MLGYRSVHELVRSILPKPTRKSGGHPGALEKTWMAIKGDITTLLEIRNQLAHSPASPQAEISPNPQAGRRSVVVDEWWASYVSGTEKMRGNPAKKNLKLDDVKDNLAKVSALYMELRNFRGALSRLPR